ncbi:hypothetical protein AAFC00_001040 [Neodothiora populina]|uniref:peptidylprolyl isomerase n=1 Tax=Neodothiora populina TaxID=2781224 RepID=A0ABR3PNM9_9PEZI
MRIPLSHPSAFLISASLFASVPTLAAAEDTERLSSPRIEDTSDGLRIEHTRELTCNRPTAPGDEIIVHYRGTLQSNGKQFDSSYDRGKPFSFGVGNGEVIAGWDEGLLDMCVGEARKLIIPPELGYGKSGAGPIPPGSSLVFETELVGVVGVNKEDAEGHEMVKVPTPGDAEKEESVTEEVGFPAADTPPAEFIPPVAVEGSDDSSHVTDDETEDPSSSPSQDDQEASGAAGGPKDSVFALEENECRLLGPFALIVQGALGLLAMLSLVFKRWRERPRRPLKVWFFDVSKQIVGTFLLHIANLAMSMFSSGSFEVQDQGKELAEHVKDATGRQPNPCSFYLLNLAIDTTIGIPVLVILLKVLTALFLRTSLANPPASIKSGHYGNPPRIAWWMKQSLIYFLGLLGMKLFVLFLFSALPWLGWVGDWALRWTEGNEALQIAFVMFVFPVCMNAAQYYIVDSFIKEKSGGEEGTEGVDRSGFERVAQHDEDDEIDEEGEGSADERGGRRRRRRGSSASSSSSSSSRGPIHGEAEVQEVGVVEDEVTKKKALEVV